MWGCRELSFEISAVFWLETYACLQYLICAEAESMDAVIFCLALMGVDYPLFLKEGKRVLKQDGQMWIAEVRSRFVTDKVEDTGPFLQAVESLGFKIASQMRNKMFVVFELQADSRKTALDVDWPLLKACVYKQRWSPPCLLLQVSWCSEQDPF